MTTLRRIFTGTAFLALASTIAFGDTISYVDFTGNQTATGNIPTFTAPGTNSTSAAQWNQTVSNADIIAGCPAGYSCSAANLYEIDFTITANLSSTVTIVNTSGAVSQIPSEAGHPGTFGNPNSGIAVSEVATVELQDPLSGPPTNLGDTVVVVPTFNTATNAEYSTTGGTGCSGTATKKSFVNCLNVAKGTTYLSGTGSATKGESYTTSDPTWSTEASTYTGAGSVPFSLVLSGLTQDGGLPAGTTIPTNVATISSLTNGLVVTYDYSFTETLIPPPPSSPEPTTFVLMGGALVGIGLICKRLKKT